MNVFDANPTAALSFLQQQAAHIEPEVYRIEYPELKYTNLLPLDSSAPDWAQTVIFQSVDGRGELKVLGPNSTDVPTVDIAKGQGFHNITTAALGYTYTLEELGFAMLNNTSLDMERARIVRDSVEQGLNKIYLLGDKEIGEGLYTSSDVSNITLPGTIASLVAAINTDGPQPIVNLFASMFDAIMVTQTKGVHQPDTVVMPLSAYRLLATAIFGNNNASNVSVLEYLRRAFPQITNWESDINLEDAGAGGASRMIMYKKDMRIVKGHDVMPLQFLAPATADNIHFKVPAITRTGGTEWRVPAAAAYMDGV